ncbi:MAG: aldehyde dehydrogenase [Cellulosilyticaceae bacterium]
MNINEIVEMQRRYFATGITKDIRFRIENLKILKNCIKNNEEKIMEALQKDLGKSAFESYETEIGMVLEEINIMLKSIKRWSKAKRVKTPITHFPSVSRTYKEPYGVVLIMSPWNYPFQLAIAPLIGAIASGNCAIVKPSEYSFYTSELIEDMIKECFSGEYVSVIRGGRQTNQILLEERFDYIFFTGSVNVGKIVMKAASKYLTPVTLELGGKSPCIVEKTADVKMAARRIVWGKYLNAGQTCVGVDYVLVQSEIKNQLISEMKKQIRKFYGEKPIHSEDLPRIINQKHFDRLKELIVAERVIEGGDVNREELKIAPTIMDNINFEDKIMQEEIFGPILPVIGFGRIEEAINQINRKPKPLACYCFTRNKEIENRVLDQVAFGGGCINDTIIQLANPYMAFGGVGESGMGGYHGKASFETFTHTKSVLKKSNLIDIPLRYPPYKDHLEMLKKIMK